LKGIDGEMEMTIKGNEKATARVIEKAIKEI